MRLAFAAGVHYSTGEIQCAWVSVFLGAESSEEYVTGIWENRWLYLRRKNEDGAEAFRFSEILELKCFETTADGERFMEEQSLWFSLS